MTFQNPIWNAMRLFFSAAAIFLVLPIAYANADQSNDAIVHKVLLKRTTNTCKAVLPAWFKSEHGVQDPKVRGLVADCYMGHARLSILGVKTGVSLAETSLSEVPAALLKQKTGINLDIHRPLAGRTLRSQVERKKTDDQ
jgi:hypothetical protein